MPPVQFEGRPHIGDRASCTSTLRYSLGLYLWDSNQPLAALAHGVREALIDFRGKGGQHAPEDLSNRFDVLRIYFRL
jgi:hypothetical protein